jgi:general secretion pathway protein B
MSYILEALKKSEHARLAAKLPDLQRIVLSAEAPARERTAWLYAATLASVVAGATGLGWWFSGKPLEKPRVEKAAVVAPLAESSMAREPATTPPDRAKEPAAFDGGARNGDIKPAFNTALSTAPVQTTRPAIKANAQTDMPGPKKPESKPRGVTDRAGKVAGNAGLPVPKQPAGFEGLASVVLDKKLASSRMDKPLAPAPLEPPGPKPAPGSRVLRIDQLPIEVRRDVPKISATGYVDSAGTGMRVVSINERSLQEGDELIGGMRLEQIAPDHVLFSFRGYRFRVEMF